MSKPNLLLSRFSFDLKLGEDILFTMGTPSLTFLWQSAKFKKIMTLSNFNLEVNVPLAYLENG